MPRISTIVMGTHTIQFRFRDSNRIKVYYSELVQQYVKYQFIDLDDCSPVEFVSFLNWVDDRNRE